MARYPYANEYCGFPLALFASYGNPRSWYCLFRTLDVINGIDLDGEIALLFCDGHSW